MPVIDPQADALSVFDVLGKDGVAIVPLDVAYAIFGGSGNAIRRIFEAKGRSFTKPNGMLADQIVDNLGLRVYRRFKTEIGITYDTPPVVIDLFVRGIRAILLQHAYTRKDVIEVHLNNFGSSSLNILLYTFFDVPDWGTELKSRHELMHAIMVLAGDLGVRFAFPTQTLHIEEFPGKGATTPPPKSDRDGEPALARSLVPGCLRRANGPIAVCVGECNSAGNQRR